ncbi:hypothetical protein IKD56_04295 [bacterium]|nr:hypothetical protein [bacterium]
MFLVESDNQRLVINETKLLIILDSNKCLLEISMIVNKETCSHSLVNSDTSKYSELSF